MTGELQAGVVQRLQVAREVSPNGYFLTNGTREVLLHYSEVIGNIKPGDEVDVFLFHDTEDRLAATMKKPLLHYGETGVLEVADVVPRLGCFLEIGLGRQLLVPEQYLPELESLRPQRGDRLFVTIARDKQGRMLGKLAKEEELLELCVKAPANWKNRTVACTVYKPLQMGTFVVCDAQPLGFGVIGFIHAGDRSKLLRLGERLEARVSFVREDGRVNLSMRPPKQIGRLEDADRLIAFMKERPNGAMPYSDETPADIIMNRFQMSKSAFKRALGKLMKEGLVYQQGSWTHLKRAESDREEG